MLGRPWSEQKFADLESRLAKAEARLSELEKPRPTVREALAKAHAAWDGWTPEDRASEIRMARELGEKKSEGPGEPKYRDWVIVAPPYTANSSGIKYLHWLGDELLRLELAKSVRLAFVVNGDTTFAQEGPASWKRFGSWLDSIKDPREAEGAIVIQPEVVPGNLLNARDLVRFFLNRNGYVNGRRVTPGPREFLATQSRVIMEGAHVLSYMEVDPVFHASGALPLSRRTIDVSYVGKGKNALPALPRCFPITRHYPASQAELADLLRRARYFHTCDPWSLLNWEAILCGAVPVVHSWDPWTPEEVDRYELSSLVRQVAGRLPTDKEWESVRSYICKAFAEQQASWPERLRQFVRAAEKHFEESPL